MNADSGGRADATTWDRPGQPGRTVNYPFEREKVPPAPQSKKTPAIPRVQNRRPMLREEDPICTRVSTCGDDILATEDLVFLQLGGAAQL